MFTLKVSNFQAIKDIELQVSGLTVVTAPTHSGKTSLVRATNALLTANWYQEAYMRRGSNLSNITLSYGSDSITYTRKGASSSYTINGETFSKLNGCAPAVLSQLGFGEITIPRSAKEVITLTPQVQNQFDGPYQDTIDPVALTQLLGSFTNLVPYQTAQDRAKKQQGDLRRELDRSQVEHKKLSAIYSSLASYTPSFVQTSLETLSKVAINTGYVHNNLCDFSRVIEIYIKLLGVKSKSNPCTPKSIQSVRVASLSSYALCDSVLNRTRLLSLLSMAMATRRRLTASFSTCIPLVKQVSNSTSSFRANTDSWSRYPLVLRALTIARSNLPEPPRLAEIKVLGSSILGVQGLLHKSQAYLEELKALTVSLTDAKTSLADLQAQHNLVNSSLQEGKCPLCLTEMKTRKTKTSKETS